MPLWWAYSVLTQWPSPLLWSEENVRNFRIDLHGFDVLCWCVTWQITMTCLYSFLFFWEKQLVSILNKRKRKNNMNTAFKSVKKQYKRNFIVGHHQEVIFLSLFLNAERVKCYLISAEVLLLKIKKEKFSKKQNKVYTKKTLYRLLGTFSFSFFFYILVNYLSIALIKLDKCLKCECKGWNSSP